MKKRPGGGTRSGNSRPSPSQIHRSLSPKSGFWASRDSDFSPKRKSGSERLFTKRGESSSKTPKSGFFDVREIERNASGFLKRPQARSQERRFSEKRTAQDGVRLLERPQARNQERRFSEKRTAQDGVRLLERPQARNQERRFSEKRITRDGVRLPERPNRPAKPQSGWGYANRKPKEPDYYDEPDFDEIFDGTEDGENEPAPTAGAKPRRLTPAVERRKRREIQKKETQIALRRKQAAGIRPDMPFDERELRYRDYVPPQERERLKSKKNGEKASASTLPEFIRLNRYIALSGYCARREADRLIEEGKVKVNGEIVHTLGFKVHVKNDKVEIGGKTLKPEKPIYILLNKPKNCVTTVSDPEGRPTVMDIVQTPGGERIFPVGRLDRNTTGVLLLTNDGELAQKLTHPSHRVKKVYRVTLDKPVTQRHMIQLTEGVMLEDGEATVDSIYYPDPSERRQVIVEIHSGRNRLVRRMFEALEYKVEKLDRTEFGPLSKKGLPRGRYRMLTPQEIGFLMMV